MMQDYHRYVMILAGGSGKRLWPISRQDLPKQLLPVDGSQTLLEKTIDRMERIVPRERQLVITSAPYEALVREMLSTDTVTVLAEPEARNTAAAVMLGCAYLKKHDPRAVVVIVPADHMIADEVQFAHVISKAVAQAQKEQKIVLVGVKPEYPATGYGYIEVAHEKIDNYAGGYYAVKRFHEKPSLDVACFYAYSDNMLWNCGIICAPLSVLLAESERYMPYITDTLMSDSGDQDTFAERYAQLPSVSIDYALLEKTDRRSVVAGDFGWSDVGSLEAFIGACRPPDHQKILSFFDASHNSAYSNKLVIFSGVNDICVVDTGDMLLVTRRDLMDRSSEIAQQMLAKGFVEYT